MSDVPELDPIASAALASIILERTADALSDQPELMAAAITNMADETALSLDVCAGVLLACATLIGAGQIPAEAVAAAAMQLDPATVEGVVS